MKVLLAQFRKPPVESRFFERLGTAFREGGFTVASAGCRTIPFYRMPEDEPSVHALFDAGSGIVSSFRNLQKLHHLIGRELPGILVFCSPEISLLLPLLRLQFPECRIVFDLQENHCLNIRAQLHNRRPRRLHGLIAGLLVRMAIRFSHRVWMAESVYQKQLPRAAKKAFLIENRPIRQLAEPASPEHHWLLSFTGFITEESGIRRAIRMVEILAKQRPNARLLVCGYCPDENLRLEINRHPLVNCLMPADQWASDAQIRRCLLNSKAQLMPYFETAANEEKSPSKWFSSLALNVPVWYQSNSVLSLPEKDRIGFPVDFDAPDENLINRWEEFCRSFQPETNRNSFWSFDMEGFRNEIQKLAVNPSS
jgi:hypothetical protein